MRVSDTVNVFVLRATVTGCPAGSSFPHVVKQIACVSFRKEGARYWVVVPNWQRKKD